MASRTTRGPRPTLRPALPASRTPTDTSQSDPAWHGPSPARIGPAKAVALEYRPQRDEDRPRIVASGRGAVAEQIVQVAFANGVKVREDSDLVEILSLLEPDSPIPLEALAAVAEVLAYVYRAEGRAPPEPAEAADMAAGSGDGVASTEQLR